MNTIPAYIHIKMMSIYRSQIRHVTNITSDPDQNSNIIIQTLTDNQAGTMPSKLYNSQVAKTQHI